MANVKLTQNMRFFKSVEKKKDYEEELKNIIEEWIQETSNANPNQAALDLLKARFIQFKFSVEEFFREAIYPLRLRG